MIYIFNSYNNSWHYNIANKHIGINDAPVQDAAVAAHEPVAQAKPLSPNCNYASDSSHAPYEKRLEITQEQMDVIN